MSIQRLSRYGLLVRSIAAVFFACGALGCGVAITAGVAGGIAVSKGDSSGGGTPPSVSTASRSAEAAGVASVTFTLVDAEGDAASVCFRYSTDPTESSALPFPSTPTGQVQGLAGEEPWSLPCSSGGTNYVFVWNTGADLGTTLNENTVRVQILLDGSVAYTTPLFTVDNTTAPIIRTIELPVLGGGASQYADGQHRDSENPDGCIPLRITIADSDSQDVTVKVLYSTDGGTSFSENSVAVGSFYDASNTGRATYPLATSSGGTTYTYRWLSRSNGFSFQDRVRIRFQATDSREGGGVASTEFVVNNTELSSLVDTPSELQVGAVGIKYVLMDEHEDRANIQVQFSATGPEGPFYSATELPQAPSSGTANLPTSSGGLDHTFLWNAYYDVAHIASPVFSGDRFVVRVTPIKRATGLAGSASATLEFSLDERMVQTVAGELLKGEENVPMDEALLSQNFGVCLGEPGGDFYFMEGFYDPAIGGRAPIRIGDMVARRVRTLGGDGEWTDDNRPIEETKFEPMAPDCIGMGLDLDAWGNIFIATGGGDNRVRRIDKASGIVTTLAGWGGDSGEGVAAVRAQLFGPVSVAVVTSDLGGGASGTVVYVAEDGQSRVRKVANGIINTVVGDLVGGAAQIDSQTLYTNLLNVDIGMPNYVSAAESGPLAHVLLISDPSYSMVYAANLSTSLVTLWPNRDTGGGPGSGVISLPPGTLRLVCGTGQYDDTGDGGLSTDASLRLPVQAVADASGDIYILDKEAHRIRRVRYLDGVIEAFAGKQGEGYSGDGGPAAQALFSLPSSFCWLSDGTMLVTDQGNHKIRAIDVDPSRTISTLVGATEDTGDGDLATSARLDAGVFGVASTADEAFIAEGANRIRFVDSDGVIDTYAGSGSEGFGGDGEPAKNSIFKYPRGLALAGDGTLYVADRENCRIRRIDAGGTNVATIAGDGTWNSDGDGGPAADSRLVPSALALWDSDEVLLVGDGAMAGMGLVRAINLSGGPKTVAERVIPASYIDTVAGGGANQGDVGTLATDVMVGSVRAITVDAGGFFFADNDYYTVYRVEDASGEISLVIGSGTQGYLDGGFTTARFDHITGLLWDAGRDCLVIVDAGNHRVRVANLSGGLDTFFGQSIVNNRVDTVAGTGEYGYADGAGTSAKFRFSAYDHVGLSLYGSGTTSVLIADSGNKRVRQMVDDGTISTFAGGGEFRGDGGPATRAPMSPVDVAVLGSGDLVILDRDGSSGGMARYVNTRTGVIETIAGTSASGFDGDGGPAAEASFLDARSIAVDGDGNVFVASKLRVRAVNRQSVPLQVGAVTIDPGEIGTVAGTGVEWPGVGNPTGDGGPATAAVFMATADVAIVGSRLYLADDKMHTLRVVNLDRAGGSSFTAVGEVVDPGEIERVAGIPGFAGPLGTDGLARNARLNCPMGVAVDATGIVYVADNGTHLVRAVNPGTSGIEVLDIDVTAGWIVRVAGNPPPPDPPPYDGDGQPATHASVGLVGPVSVAVLSDGDLLIGSCDTMEMSYRIRIVDGGTGIIDTLLGGNEAAHSGDGSVPENARVEWTMGLAVDPWDTIYVADTDPNQTPLNPGYIRRLRRFP